MDMELYFSIKRKQYNPSYTRTTYILCMLLQSVKYKHLSELECMFRDGDVAAVLTVILLFCLLRCN